jgi:hypothetical protein
MMIPTLMNGKLPTREMTDVSDSRGKLTGIWYQSFPNTVANSVMSNHPRSSGAVSMHFAELIEVIDRRLENRIISCNMR